MGYIPFTNHSTENSKQTKIDHGLLSPEPDDSYAKK